MMPLGDLLEHLDPLAAEFGKFRRARHSDLDGLLARIALLLAKNEAPVFALLGSPLYEARSQKQLNVSMGLTPSRPSKSQGANKISIAVAPLERESRYFQLESKKYYSVGFDLNPKPRSLNQGRSNLDRPKAHLAFRTNSRYAADSQYVCQRKWHTVLSSIVPTVAS